MKNFFPFGLMVPDILLPLPRIPLSRWAVVACDQYTQNKEYWEGAAAAAGDSPSTLELILPEVYLDHPDKGQRIQAIHHAMRNYLHGEIFRPAFTGFIYVERRTEFGRIRRGLVAAVDLEAYQWQTPSTALIRATEATIPERIPPRMEIRRGAALELPHIMLLANDKSGRLVEGCGQYLKARHIKPVYEGDLMLGAGHVTGYPIEGEGLEFCREALESLLAENTDHQGNAFLFAVGDGNHSLATAKAVWEEYRDRELAEGKTLADLEDCPLRYALTEIVNIYDQGLTFEPIHRVVFTPSPRELMEFCAKRLAGQLVPAEDQGRLEGRVASSTSCYGFVFMDEGGRKQYLCLETPPGELAISRLQPVLDAFRSNGNKELEMDYIHGSQEVFRLGSQEGCLAILLPPVAKDSFFTTIATGGPLPRKSFSMGEASEKRFYLEARQI